MTGIFLGGLAALIVSSIGVFASSADAFSSVLSRGLGVSPLSAIRRLAQDTGEMPRDDQTTPPPSSSGDSQPAAAPPATEQPPGEPRGDDPAPPVVREPEVPSDGTGSQPPTDNPPVRDPGDERRDSPEGQQPNGNPPVSSVPPRTSENDGTNRPEGRPSESGDEVRGGQSVTDSRFRTKPDGRKAKNGRKRRGKAKSQRCQAAGADEARDEAQDVRIEPDGKTFNKFVAKGLTVPASCSEALAEASR